MLAPRPISSDRQPPIDRAPLWGSKEWGAIRRPVVQLIAAPILTILALELTIGLPRGPWMLLPIFGPATVIAFLMNRKNGLVLMWPLLALISILAVWASALLALGTYD